GIETAALGDAERFDDQFGLDRFILYIGRKDAGKNVPLLVNYFCDYKASFRGDLKLVLIGAGATEIPEEYEHDVIDLGLVSSQTKCDACAAAVAVCQPSTNE